MHICMPLIILMKLTSSHSTPLTHLISLNSSHLCSYIYFFCFIYPSPLCFFIKLLTCGVIRSYNFLFVGARHGGSLVVPRCGSPLCLLSRGLPKDVSPPKDWWDFLFPPTRARAFIARARVGVTQFASRNLGDGKYLEGFGTQMIIKL